MPTRPRLQRRAPLAEKPDTHLPPTGAPGCERLVRHEHVPQIVRAQHAEIFALHLGRQHLDQLTIVEPELDHPELTRTPAKLGGQAFARGNRLYGFGGQARPDRDMSGIVAPSGSGHGDCALVALALMKLGAPLIDLDDRAVLVAGRCHP